MSWGAEEGSPDSKVGGSNPLWHALDAFPRPVAAAVSGEFWHPGGLWGKARLQVSGAGQNRTGDLLKVKNRSSYQRKDRYGGFYE